MIGSNLVVYLGRVGEYLALGTKEGNIIILAWHKKEHFPFGKELTIPITILLFFIQEYQKHFPIKIDIHSGDWRGFIGTSE